MSSHTPPCFVYIQGLYRPQLSLGHLCPELHRDTGVTPGAVRSPHAQVPTPHPAPSGALQN